MFLGMQVLEVPHRVKSKDEYWGCFSWIDLDPGVPLEAWENARPALTDDQFEFKQQLLLEGLQGLEGLQELDI